MGNLRHRQRRLHHRATSEPSTSSLPWMAAHPDDNPTVALVQTNAARRPASPTTTGAAKRKTRGRGLVLRRKVVGMPMAGRTPAWAWVSDVAFNSTAGERPLFCTLRHSAKAELLQPLGILFHRSYRLFSSSIAPNLLLSLALSCNRVAHVHALAQTVYCGLITVRTSSNTRLVFAPPAIITARNTPGMVAKTCILKVTLPRAASGPRLIQAKEPSCSNLLL